MKFRISCLPIVWTGQWGRLQVGPLDLTIQRPGWVTPSGREAFLVQSNRPMGGYVGLSLGANGYHIGSPTENQLLRAAMEELAGVEI